MHFFFWRSVRGGERGRAILKARFDAWERKDYARVFDTLMSDAARARGKGPRTPEASISRVMILVHAGQLSKATRVLTSLGVADADDARIVAQMAAKHPRRLRPVDFDLSQFPSADHIELSLSDTYRLLPPCRRRSRRAP